MNKLKLPVGKVMLIALVLILVGYGIYSAGFEEVGYYTALVGFWYCVIVFVIWIIIAIYNSIKDFF